MKSGDTNRFLPFECDDASTAGLHVRRAVAEFVLDPDVFHMKPDITPAMRRQTRARLHLSRELPEDLIRRGDIEVQGNAAEAARVINPFDRYRPEKAIVIPPAILEHANSSPIKGSLTCVGVESARRPTTRCSCQARAQAHRPCGSLRSVRLAPCCGAGRHRQLCAESVGRQGRSTP